MQNVVFAKIIKFKIFVEILVVNIIRNLFVEK